MILMIIVLIAGFALLVKGADWFVDGACDLSARLKIPAYVVGLTVVAMGTSLPEAAVSVTASLQGSNAIAIGNVIGSNTFNTLVVLGSSALFAPVVVKKNILKRDFPFCILITVIMLILMLTLNNGVVALTRIDGLVLLALFAAFMIFSFKSAQSGEEETAETIIAKDTPLWRCVATILIGVAGVITGGQMTVKAAVYLAGALGLSETVIGLTVVAIGTSLPELVTSVVAARKHQNDIAVGNVIGSNIFNILFILGISSLISDISTDDYAVIDMTILIGICLLTYLAAIPKKKITAPVGALMIAAYIGYTAFLLVR